MPYASTVLKSPAVPSAILLYGIVFLFAATYFVGSPWQKAYTIALYAGISVWTAILAIDRFKQRRLAMNRIDIVFTVFLISILVSAAINWWGGTLQYLKLMPALFLVPYVVGRTMHAEDGFSLRLVIVFMGILLLVLILPEYLRVLKYGLPNKNSPAPVLFGQGHGVMLSGLLLAVTLLGMVSVLLSPHSPKSLPLLTFARGRYFGYVLLSFIIVAMGWISSRGGALAGIVGVSILLVLAPSTTRGRKFEILLVIALALALASVHSMQWKANSAHYAAVMKSPVEIFVPAAGDAIDSPGSVEWRGSILGNEACERIVDSVTDRWVHYQQAVALFLTKPVFGVGANHYGFFACTRPGSFPHSTLLQVLAELGSIVGLVYCALIWLMMSAFMRARSRAGESAEAAIWSWFVAFAAMQVLIAQLNGNYFVSAALYFVVGAAASVHDRNIAAMGSH